jgi:hypothetical protein
MTKYLEKRFVVAAPDSDKYRQEWERIFLPRAEANALCWHVEGNGKQGRACVLVAQHEGDHKYE